MTYGTFLNFDFPADYNFTLGLFPVHRAPRGFENCMHAVDDITLILQNDLH